MLTEKRKDFIENFAKKAIETYEETTEKNIFLMILIVLLILLTFLMVK